MRASVRAAVLLAIPWSSAAGCLPTDTRPPPGKVHVTVSPDDAIVSGVTTADGWKIGFSRLLIALGHVSLEGDECVTYSDPDYARVLDLTAEDGPQKLALAYAVGHCTFDMELSSPHEDSVLGGGATRADKAFLRTPGTDTFTKDSGISIFVAGSATRGGERKTFAWPYRRRVDYATCSVPIDGEDVEDVAVKSGESVTIDLLVRGSGLFDRSRVDEETPLDGGSEAAASTPIDEPELLFQAFADADSVSGDGDGVVTLEELGRVKLSALANPDGGVGGGGPDAGPYTGLERWPTLLDYVYDRLFPLMVRYRETGTCAMEVFSNNRTPR